MWIAKTLDDCRRLRRALRGTVAFVPTMGALHEGHLSLVRRGRELADHVLVSIFVNPTQFGPAEDFNRYPRPIEQDLALCEGAGVAGVCNPGVPAMYPTGALDCMVDVPALDSILEGAFRPGHFRGVCRVVTKLFHLVEPDVACFGMKDYQQLKVIEAMVAGLDFPLRIEPCPTLREPDGLAMSSRNVYLTKEDRPHALGLYKALLEAKRLVEQAGEPDPQNVERAMKETLAGHQAHVQYAVVRHPQTLAELDSIQPALTGGVVALIAAKVGNVRLIDNMVVGK